MGNTQFVMDKLGISEEHANKVGIAILAWIIEYTDKGFKIEARNESLLFPRYCECPLNYPKAERSDVK